MRKRLIASVAVSLFAAPAAMSAPQPHLTLVRTRPVIVDGAGFRHAERVHLLLRSPRGVSGVKVSADGGGAFTARFPVDIEVRCVGFSITARGSAGSFARFLRRQPASCTRAS
jgi:hypothetical protein